MKDLSYNDLLHICLVVVFRISREFRGNPNSLINCLSHRFERKPQTLGFKSFVLTLVNPGDQGELRKKG